MSLQLKRRPGRPNWYMHGTVRGITVRESTGVADAKAAEAIRARREWEIIQRSVFGPEATTTFVGAAVSYLEAGGERTHLKRIIARIGSLPLAKIDQSVIEQTARSLCFPRARRPHSIAAPTPRSLRCSTMPPSAGSVRGASSSAHRSPRVACGG